MIDLHMHSNFSDGSDTPTQLIDKALKLNLKAIALTDHDTIDGLEEFLSYGSEKDILTLPGIEISIDNDPMNENKDVHVIGLNIDIHSSEFKSTLEKQLDARIKQKEGIVKRLREEFGYDITFDEVQNLAGSKSIGRPHIIEILLKNNKDELKDKTREELFKFIGSGGPAYVPRTFKLDLKGAIDLIKTAHGTSILAHPGMYSIPCNEEFVKVCIEKGIEGIEVEYTYDKNRPFYGTDKAEWAQSTLPDYYREIAKKYDLIKSGGSDYHGLSKKNIEMGDANVPNDYLKQFE